MLQAHGTDRTARRLIGGLAAILTIALIAAIGLTLAGFDLTVLVGMPRTTPAGNGASLPWYYKTSTTDPLFLLP